MTRSSANLLSRTLITLFACLLLMLMGTQRLQANDISPVPQHIRVLLHDYAQGMNSLHFSSPSGIRVRENGTELWDSAGYAVTVESSFASFWNISGLFDSYGAAYAQGVSLLGSALPWQVAYYNSTWQVWIGNALGSPINENTVRSALPQLVFSAVQLPLPVMALHTSLGETWVYAGHITSADANSTALMLESANGDAMLVDSKNHNYAGAFEVYTNAQGTLMLINEVDTEYYVSSALSLEMSPSWPIEALKAQAVAIRTMAAYRHASVQQGQIYTLNDRELSYVGVDRMQGQVWEAVQATAGELLLWDNAPIQATFHADSGGHTQNSEDVWFAALPYLRGVAELFPSEGPDAAWPDSAPMDGLELAQKLRAAGRGDIGTVERVVTEAQTLFGAATRLRFVGTNGDIVLEMGAIREVFQLKSNNVWLSSERPTVAKGATSAAVPSFPGAYVRSSAGSSAQVLHEMPVVRSASGVEALTPTEETEGFAFSGAGWGHGVGLSQWGAKVMADHGYAYQDILAHYYTGAVLAP